MKFTVKNAQANVTVAEYESDSPILPYDIDPAYVGVDFVTYNEFGAVVEMSAINPQSWKVSVGAFFDRFGDQKLPILASADPMVQAIVKDASVRKFIDLYGRRAELEGAIALLQSKGFTISSTTLLDTPPTTDELA